MPISNIFEIGKRSLLAYQSAIQTTSGNVANANNENYSRRRADLQQSLTGFASLGLSGDDVVRLRQRFAEQQLWQESQRLGEYESAGRLLRQIENVFAENTESGINNLLNQFWNAWDDLANDPESAFARNLLRDKARLLTSAFQRVHGDFRQLQSQIQPEVEAQIRDVNERTARLAEINSQLMYKKNDPDLMDERDRLIGELSETLDIKVKEKENGVVSIYTDGLLLVADNKSNDLRMEIETESGEDQIKIYLSDSSRAVHMGSGSLKALVEIHNEKIPDYLDQLDRLAVTIAQKVNEIHMAGENLDGTTNVPFFADDVTGAANFRVDDAVLDDPSLIATRLPGEGDGSGSIAQAISDLQSEKVIGGVTINDYYNGLISDVGSKIHEADFMEQSQQLVVQQIKNQKEAVTGVSLDEEMTKLVQFQQAYSAAAKIVTTVNAMVDTVLNMQ
ncbi:MAG TPA: flagellar hook-associated protein FlgK [Caldithrix abyssi]|uniref:Flagellar hook-associated protein 1 n=1 Tax=Caldithrix abyssi TaxID=187145 RepID=A0A7V5PQM4_CALAY|nr:flagellar hook-associated protein FlgK [Caldithrix abyssi]